MLKFFLEKLGITILLVGQIVDHINIEFIFLRFFKDSSHTMSYYRSN